jgi:hypothetical protein
MIFYCTTDCKLLFDSLKRYFKYILECNLESVEEGIYSSVNTLKIFLLNELHVKEEFVIEYSDLTNYSIVLLGLGDPNSLNLLEFSQLSNNLKNLLNLSFSQQLFSDDEIKSKLKNLFHSHGQDSLFEKLSNCQYYISNGIKLYSIGELDEETFQHNFIKPGKDSWNLFKERLNRYRYFLHQKCQINEIDEIFLLISSIDQLLDKMIDNIKSGEKSFEENNLDEFIALINQINEILLQIYRNLSSFDAEI